jgi:hypothetical protein
MSKKKLLLLSIFLFIGIFSFLLYDNEQPLVITSTNDSGHVPVTQKNEIKTDSIKDEEETVLKKVASSKVIENANELIKMFDFPSPPLNEENLEKYNLYMGQLNENPMETLSYFNTVLETSSEEDDKRSLIINFVNKLDLTRKEKSDFYSAYISKIDIQSSGKTLDDNSLSVLLAVDFLSQNISPSQAPVYIEQVLSRRNKTVQNSLLDRFAIYFPELVTEYR